MSSNPNTPEFIVTLSELQDRLCLLGYKESRPNARHIVAELVFAIRKGLVLDECGERGGGLRFLQRYHAPQEIIEAWRKAEEEGRVHFMNFCADRSQMDSVTTNFLKFLKDNGFIVTNRDTLSFARSAQGPQKHTAWVTVAVSSGMKSMSYPEHALMAGFS